MAEQMVNVNILINVLHDKQNSYI